MGGRRALFAHAPKTEKLPNPRYHGKEKRGAWCRENRKREVGE